METITTGNNSVTKENLIIQNITFNGKDINEGTVPVKVNTNSVTYTLSQIGLAANITANYIATNKNLPSVVSAGSIPVNMNDLLYLMCKSLSTTTNINCGVYSHVTSTTGTNKPDAYFVKDQYTNLANSIVQCYESNLRNPKGYTYKDTTFCFDDRVYLYSRVAAYKYQTGNMATTVKICSLYNQDYSTQEMAQQSSSNSAFCIYTNCKSLGSGKYTLTLTPSQTSNIYYTTNGNTPTNTSTKYTSPFTITNTTWVRFMAVNSNNEKTPILSYAINRATIPYINSKPVPYNNNYKINIASAQASTVYYTINGSKPSTNSLKATGTLQINNNTLLQYMAVTTSNNKQSSIYYYRIQNPTPYVTILNTTPLSNNQQKILIIANKPGKTYYTINGTNPNTNSQQYTSGTIINLQSKTTIKAILIDKNNKQSETLTYTIPTAKTSIAIIKPINTLTNNQQKITFTTNQPNTNVYYTTDGTNPLTSNTKKTGTTNSQITIHKTTQLKYYTTTTEGYKSSIYNYRTPQHPEERPTITVYNTTPIQNDGTQKILIQSNQPGKLNITKYVGTNTPIEQKNINNEITTNTNTRIQIYTQYDGKYSKTIEYTPTKGMQVVMNYNYTVKLPNINKYEKVYFYANGNYYEYLMSNTQLNQYIHIDLSNYHITTKTNGYMNQPGITIHKSNTLEITFTSTMYGETNVINAVMYSLQPNHETLFVYSNGTRLFDISWKKTNTNPENVTTYFQTLSNKFTKNETITYKPRDTMGCGNYDIVQTYILTNIKITNQFYNQSLYNISHYNVMDDLLRITPQDRTIITGLTTLWEYDGYAEYLNYLYNITSYRSDETLCIVGINYNRVNYVHFNDLKMGMVVSGNSSNKFWFNIQSSSALSEISRISLNLIKENLGKSSYSLFIQLDNNSKTYIYENNETGIICLYSNNLENVFIFMNTSSGIIYNLIVIDGFEYNGAISDCLIEEYNSKDYMKNNLKSYTNPCFEDMCNNINTENAKTLMGYSTDSGWSEIESVLGSLAVTYGVGIALGLITAPIGIPAALALTIAAVGYLAIMDSHGILTGQATSNDWNEFYIDTLMLPIGAGISKGTPIIGKTAFKQITKGQTVKLSSTEMTTEMNGLLWSISTASSECISYARDKIIDQSARIFVEGLRGEICD